MLTSGLRIHLTNIYYSCKKKLKNNFTKLLPLTTWHAFIKDTQLQSPQYVQLIRGEQNFFRKGRGDPKHVRSHSPLWVSGDHQSTLNHYSKKPEISCFPRLYTAHTKISLIMLLASQSGFKNKCRLGHSLESLLRGRIHPWLLQVCVHISVSFVSCGYSLGHSYVLLRPRTQGAFVVRPASVLLFITQLLSLLHQEVGLASSVYFTLTI